VYWTYARLDAGTVVGPPETKFLRNAARVRSASGSPARYELGGVSFVKGILKKLEADAEVTVARRTARSRAENECMLKKERGPC
jgi:hypothetical protein